VQCAEEVVRACLSFADPIQELTHALQFKERWLSLSGGSIAGSSARSRKGRKLHTLLRELSDDEDQMVDTGLEVPDDPQRPWIQDYHAYMDVVEQLPDGWSAVQWWGVSNFFRLR
jgi:hypothetical protein